MNQTPNIIKFKHIEGGQIHNICINLDNIDLMQMQITNEEKFEMIVLVRFIRRAGPFSEFHIADKDSYNFFVNYFRDTTF